MDEVTDVVRTYSNMCKELSNIERAIKAYEERFTKENPTKGSWDVRDDETYKRLEQEMLEKKRNLISFENSFPIKLREQCVFGVTKDVLEIFKKMILDIYTMDVLGDTDLKELMKAKMLLNYIDDYELYKLFMDLYYEKILRPTRYQLISNITRCAVSSTFFWLEHLYKDTKGLSEEHYYINGNRYTPIGEGHDQTPCGGYLKSKDGKYDGTKDIQCWCQGNIPRTLSEGYMKDNAEFIKH